MSRSLNRNNWKVPAGIDAEGDVDSKPRNRAYAVDGALEVRSHLALLSKGTAGAYTLAAPTTAQNGTIIHIVSTTAAAHVITTGAAKYNATNNTATLGVAIGNGVTLIAQNGVWYSRGATNCTFSTV